MNDNYLVNKIDINKVFPHPDNPRQDLGDLTELTESIRKNGVMQILTVIPKGENLEEFTVLIGHRRLAAAKLAGKHNVPCRIILKDIPDHKEQIAIMLEENMQRNDLTIVEQAQGFQMMLDLGYSADEIAQKTGFSETTIYHRINIAKLDKEELEKKITGMQLSITDLYLLEQIKDEEIRNQILRSSNSRESFRWNIDSKIAEIAREKELKKMRDFVIRLGIKQMPKVMKERFWNYESVCLYVMDPGKEWIFTKPENDENVYFMESTYGNAQIKIYRMDKPEPEKEDPKKTERDLKYKELEDGLIEIREKLREFMNYITYKEQKAIKDDDKTHDLVMDVLKHGAMSGRAIAGAMTGMSEWSMEQKEIERITDDVCKLSTKAVFLFSLIAHAIKQSVYTWDLEYSKVMGEKYMRVYNMAKEAGFSLEDRLLGIIDGTHKNYKGAKE